MKVWNYMIIMLVMIIFLSFMGYTPSGSEDITKSIGLEVNSTTGEVINADVSNSDWYDELFNKTNGLMFLAGIGVAVIVGLFSRQFDWKLTLVPFFTTFVVKFASVGWGIIQLAKVENQTWLVGIVVTIFVPLTVMFVFSIVEWFGGND